MNNFQDSICFAYNYIVTFLFSYYKYKLHICNNCFPTPIICTNSNTITILFTKIPVAQNDVTLSYRVRRLYFLVDSYSATELQIIILIKISQTLVKIYF